MNLRLTKPTLSIFTIAITCVLIVFVIFQISSLVKTNDINLITIFLTGLLTGGLTCLAVQGGLLAATLTNKQEKQLQNQTRQTDNALPIITFLITKLIAYTALGLLLGYFGSLFQLSLTAQIIMQTAVIIFMLGTAFNILDIHPIFRYFVIQPPKFLTRLVRNQSKSKTLFAPGILGAFTIFIPCGTTQAMMALAIASANPLLGASILFAFVLGTSPIFFILGYFATKLNHSLNQKFMQITAVVLIILATYNLNNVLALSGSAWTFNNLFMVQPLPQTQSQTHSSSNANSNSQTLSTASATINIIDAGYNPNSLIFKTGSNVTLSIQNQGSYTCASAFTIPYFKYQKVIRVGQTEKITLKMPDKPTQIPFMCSMGMYRGVINVV